VGVGEDAPGVVVDVDDTVGDGVAVGGGVDVTVAVSVAVGLGEGPNSSAGK
jgi:hypothetical protein